MYADDIALMAGNESDLQKLLNALNDWCNLNDMNINVSKSNIVHFRSDSLPRSVFVFKCGDQVIEYTDKYKYLGLVFNEYINLSITAKMVAQSASRALGLVIAKCKLVGGVPYNVFTKLYDSIVWPVIAYGAAVWGHKNFSCITAVQNRAMRFFLGVGRYTPSAATSGEMGWVPCFVRQWKAVANFWARISCTNSTRLNKRISLWAFAKSDRSKNWYFWVKKMLKELNLHQFCNISVPISKERITKSVHDDLMSKFVNDWSTKINASLGPSGRGHNKLRTYCKFKNGYHVEMYCTMILPPSHRAAFCKFRCGVAPIRLETGRFEGLPVDRRLCPFCYTVEDERHVLLKCNLYNDIRNALFIKANNVVPNFITLDDTEKMKIIFTEPNMIRMSAKSCHEILQRRRFFLCK